MSSLRPASILVLSTSTPLAGWWLQLGLGSQDLPSRVFSPRIVLERMSSEHNLLRSFSSEQVVDVFGPSEAQQALVWVLEHNDGKVCVFLLPLLILSMISVSII